MQATVFIRGIPGTPSVTQVNVRSAPGVGGTILFRINIGVQATPDSIRPDTGGDNYQGQVYKWFHLTFTDGRQGWVRNDLLDIQGDFTSFGLQNFASRVFAFAVDIPTQPTQPPPVTTPPVTTPPVTTPVPPVTTPPVTTPPVTTPPVTTPPVTTPPNMGGAPCAGAVRRDIQAKIRSAPTIRSSQVGYLNGGQAVQIIGSADGQDGDGFRWAQVSALNMTGYIREDLLTYTGDCSFFDLDGLAQQTPTSPTPPPNTPLNPQDKYGAPFHDAYTIFQEFGDTRYGSPHKGIDLDHAVGGTIFASGTGIVAYTMICTRCTDAQPNFQSQGIAFWDAAAVNDPAWGYGFGNHVVVRYAWPDLPVSMRNALAAQNLTNAYAYVIHGHMERITIAKGAAVLNGTPLGLSGNTGNSTGPHLHLEVRVSLSPNETSIYNRVVLNPRVMYTL